MLRDPELSVDLPLDITRASAVNELAHCTGGVFAAGHSPLTDLLAVGGVRLLATGLRRVAADPADLETHVYLAEGAHLYDLARNVAPGSPRRHPKRTSPITASAQQVLDSMSVPAVVQNGRLDLLAANDLGRALYADLFTMAKQPPNFARYVFLDPRAEDFYADIDQTKNLLVAVLRATAGRDPLDKQVTELIGELSTRSTDFSARWAKHNVHRHSRGRKVINHPAVGRMDLAYDDFTLPGDPHVSITTYTADPGTPSADGLTLLATWADTQKQPQTINDQVRRIRPRHP
ncbi:MmyB family transcriptional regulator [Saccharopolyspora pogona]|uniref:MmyB family transcriptional regulator n=1 Tax=Saccharopolyspora pogona TaxID=333966 RepID=UPI001683476F|nr:iron-containing alcohol dehydrogenase [Saccharopolyspora pogona]